MNSKVISIKDKIKPKIIGNDYLEGAVTQGNAAPILQIFKTHNIYERT